MYSLIIIDDEEKIANGISMLFPWKEIGFNVVGTCTSAGEAIDFVEKNQVDVILTDIEMPDMSGIDLCEELKAEHPDIQIVFFSSYNKYEYFRAAIQQGAADFLMKPVKYEQLLECFEKVKERLAESGETETKKEIEENVDQVINEIKSYLEVHYRDATLEEAAELVNLSPSYLSKIFKKKNGMSFRELLTKIRMEKSCEMIEDINCKMYDIAYYIGYDNPKNFSRAFKAYYGETPIEYRKRKVGDL